MRKGPQARCSLHWPGCVSRALGWSRFIRARGSGPASCGGDARTDWTGLEACAVHPERELPIAFGATPGASEWEVLRGLLWIECNSGKIPVSLLVF